jgi:hypothetical protein
MRERILGISYEKSRFYAKQSYFFPILGGGGGVRRVRPPLDPPLPCHILSVELCEPSCKKSLNIPKE